jgi:stage V sporulation protein G
MKNMEITDIRIKKVASEGKMKAVASVTFDNAFAVHDVKVIEGPEKLFVAMPSRRTPDGGYRDIAHPINSDMRNMLESKVLAAYDAIEDEPAPETAE